MKVLYCIVTLEAGRETRPTTASGPGCYMPFQTLRAADQLYSSINEAFTILHLSPAYWRTAWVCPIYTPDVTVVTGSSPIWNNSDSLHNAGFTSFKID